MSNEKPKRTHVLKTWTEEVKNPDGTVKLVEKSGWFRTPETQKAVVDDILGSVFKEVPVTRDGRLAPLLERDQAVVICSYEYAKIISATRMRWKAATENLHFKALTGNELIAKHFGEGKEEGGERSDLWLGYPLIPQLFLYYQYFDSPNKLLPSLIVQLVGQRYHLKKHVWLFVPEPLTQIAARIQAPQLDELSYLGEPLRYPELKEFMDKVEAGPKTTSVKEDAGKHTNMSNTSDNNVEDNNVEDRVGNFFGGVKKRYGNRF